MPQTMVIHLGTDGNFTLQFQIRNTPLAKLWVERMQARGSYPLDHPDRFYGFGTLQQEQNQSVKYIQQCINTINQHQLIIHQPFEYTQDCLNYLHNIFERYHGLLDQQDTEYWTSAPDLVRKALAELNLAVHRCENSLNPSPRFVCTWYGMSKTHQLPIELKNMFGEEQVNFGTVYLNYCEIGKTVEDLAQDNDKYISNNAFKPFSYYSADFNVKFYHEDLTEKYARIQNYINNRQDFFLAHGITSVYNTQARPMRFPVADLIYRGNQNQLISDIAVRQWIQQITLE